MSLEKLNQNSSFHATIAELRSTLSDQDLAGDFKSLDGVFASLVAVLLTPEQDFDSAETILIQQVITFFEAENRSQIFCHLLAAFLNETHVGSFGVAGEMTIRGVRSQQFYEIKVDFTADQLITITQLTPGQAQAELLTA